MMQPRVSASGAGKTPDEVAQDLCREIAAKVPASLDTEKAHESTFAISEQSGSMISLGVFLGQEIDRFNTLLKVIRFTLDQLDKAI
jgi:dynein heavy chain, axonemal